LSFLRGGKEGKSIRKKKSRIDRSRIGPVLASQKQGHRTRQRPGIDSAKEETAEKENRDKGKGGAGKIGEK